VEIETQRLGKASAINYILSRAKGQAIIFVSADTVPGEGCFAKLIGRLQNEAVGIVCGNPVPIKNGEGLVGRLVQTLWRFHGYVFCQLNEAGLARHATEVFCIRSGIISRIPSDVVNDDAFIAVSSKKKGWLIKYESQSQVSICGPATIWEYFAQRRRIMFGHYQVKKLTGEPSQHLFYLAPIHPLMVLRLSIWLIKEHSPLTVGAFLIVELASNISAITDILRKKNHSTWAMLPTTKNLFAHAARAT
jgi:cellulose synthase/poly-beta-1,6-N-acetylglucosamine synthase-like glycosyltransferase